MFTGKAVSPDLLRRVYELRVNDPVVASACDALMRGLAVQRLEPKNEDSVLNETISKWWPALVHKIAIYLDAFAFFPVVIVERDMEATPEYRKRFADRAKDKYTVTVPIIPDFGTWRASIDVQPDGDSKIVVKLDRDPDREVFVVRSPEFQGPIVDTDIVHSRVGLLLRTAAAVDRMRRYAEAAGFNSCNPCVFLETHLSATQGPMVANTLSAEGLIAGDSSIVIPIQAGSIENVTSTAEFDDVVAKTLDGVGVDPKDNVKILAPELRLPTQPRMPQIPLLDDMNRSYETRVASIFRVPLRFVGRVHSSHTDVASKSDSRLYVEGVRALRSEIERALGQISEIVYDSPFEFNLPMRVGVDLNDLHHAYEAGLLPFRTFAEEFSESTGIALDRVRRTLRRPRRPIDNDDSKKTRVDDLETEVRVGGEEEKKESS
jgi:hypothetical protein